MAAASKVNPLWNGVLELLMVMPALLATIRGTRYFSGLDPNSWQSTDWLISYEAGPIRRGLAGMLLRRVADHFPHFSVISLSLFLTALVTWSVSLYIRKGTAGMPAPQRLALAYAPFMYPVFWLCDAQAGGRKDVLAIAVVLIVSASGELGKNIKKLTRYLLGWLVLPPLILMHESIFFLAMPFFVLSALLSEVDIGGKALLLQRPRKVMADLLLVCMPSICALLFSAAYASPAARSVTLICQSWQPIYPDLACEQLATAFDAMANKERYLGLIRAGYATLFVYKQWLMALICVTLFASACVSPLIPGSYSMSADRVRTLSRMAMVLIVCAVVAVFNVPLYAFAIDYGRWMSISLSLIVIFVIGHRASLSKVSDLLEPAMKRCSLPLQLFKVLTSQYFAGFLVLMSAFYVVPHYYQIPKFFAYVGIRYKVSLVLRIIAVGF